MALVRCSCVTRWERDDDGRPVLVVVVADPDCGYVVHRVEAAHA